MFEYPPNLENSLWPSCLGNNNVLRIQYASITAITCSVTADQTKGLTWMFVIDMGHDMNHLQIEGITIFDGYRTQS